jgi:hypothetical protein
MALYKHWKKLKFNRASKNSLMLEMFVSSPSIGGATGLASSSAKARLKHVSYCRMKIKYLVPKYLV